MQNPDKSPRPATAALAAALLFTSPLSAGSAAAGTPEFSLSARLGGDSNPLSLSSRLQPEESLFTSLYTKLGYEFDSPWYVELAARSTAFADDDRADNRHASFDLGYDSRIKLDGTTYYYEIGLEAAERDKTYVSKTTGEIGTFGGRSIGDRYDYERTDFFVETHFRTKAKTRFGLTLEYQSKDYADFAIAGLSDLDYRQTRLEGDVEFRVAGDDRLGFVLALAERDYRDKRAEDLAGDPIAGSDLSYDYRDYGVRYSLRPSDRWRVDFEYEASDREDNALGAADALSTDLSLELRYELDDSATLRLQFDNRRFDYDNQVFTNELNLEEEGYSTDEDKWTLAYRRRLWQNDGGELGLEFRAVVVDRDSDKEIYRYRRNVVFVELEYAIL